MKKLKAEEMKKIYAGNTISGTIINSMWTGAKAFIDIGRYMGSSIRRFIDRNLCSY